MRCSNCGFENNNTNKFCVKCGAELSVPENKPKTKKDNGINKKVVTIIISAIVLAAVVIGVIFAVLQFSNSKHPTIEEPLIYVTKNELFCCKDTKDGVENICISNNFGGLYKLSNDNKYIIYIEGEREGNNTLYALEWSNEKAEKIPLGNNAYSIDYILGSAEKIYYSCKINEDEREIFCTDLNGNPQSVFKAEHDCACWCRDSKGNAKNLIFGYVNENKKQNIIAVNTESNSHYTISSNCDYYDNCSFPGNKIDYNDFDYANLEKIYFIEDNTLYSSDMFGNKEMISSDVRDVRVNGTDVYYLTIDNVFEDVYSNSYLYGEYDDSDSDDNPTYFSTGSVYYYNELTGSNLRLLSNVTAEKIDCDWCIGKNQKANMALYLRNCINYDAYDFNFDYDKPYDNFKKDENNIDFDEEYYILSGENAIKITTEYAVDEIKACPEQEGYLITCIPNGIEKDSEEYYEDNRKIYYFPKNVSSFDDAKMVAQNVYRYIYTEAVKGNEVIIKDGVYTETQYDYFETYTAVIGEDEIKNVWWITSDGEDLYVYSYKKDYDYEVYKYSSSGFQYLGDSAHGLERIQSNGRFYTVSNVDYDNMTFDIICCDGNKKYSVATNVNEILNNENPSIYELFYY